MQGYYTTHDSYSALQWGVLASTLLYPDISGEFELGGAPLELDTKGPSEDS